MRSRLTSDDEGFSLVEVIIAMVIVAVGLAALAAVAAGAVRSIRISGDRQDATQLASGVLETARSHDFGQIGLNTSEYDPTAPGNDAYGGETVYAASDGLVAHETVEDNLTARTWVTWANTEETEKRVTTVVSWNDRGTPKSVTQSTLVTDARRGLPVPNFQLEPEVVDEDGTPGQVVCFDHTLTNLGEQDSYSWQLYRQDGAGGWQAATPQTRSVVENGSSVTREGFKVPPGSGPGQGWFAWARMGSDVTSLQPMTDVTSDARPDSANPVPRRGQAALRLCYTPKDSSGNIDSSLDQAALFMVRVHSAFDENVVREIQDSLTVISDRQTMYLHHDYHNGSPRYANQHNYQLFLDPVRPTRTDSTINYDKESGSDPDLNPGLRIPAGQDVLFDYQNNDPVTRTIVATDPVRVGLAVASTSSLTGPPASQIDLEVSIEHYESVGQVTTVLGSTSETISLNDNGWTAFVEEISISGIDVDQTEYLRLRVSCSSPTAGEECHLHYDVAGSFESFLQVTMQ